MESTGGPRVRLTSLRCPSIRSPVPRPSANCLSVFQAEQLPTDIQRHCRAVLKDEKHRPAGHFVVVKSENPVKHVVFNFDNYVLKNKNSSSGGQLWPEAGEVFSVSGALASDL